MLCCIVTGQIDRNCLADMPKSGICSKADTCPPAPLLSCPLPTCPPATCHLSLTPGQVGATVSLVMEELGYTNPYRLVWQSKVHNDNLWSNPRPRWAPCPGSSPAPRRPSRPSSREVFLITIITTISTITIDNHQHHQHLKQHLHHHHFCQHHHQLNRQARRTCSWSPSPS